MNNSRLWATMLGFTALVSLLFAATIAFDRSPVLGLDLKGGLSVIYATAEPADQEELIVVRDLMRDQLESFGIAEPDVRVEGENIIVDLPGVSDQSEAFEALKVSGIVELRPVIQCQVVETADPSATTVPGETIPAVSDETATGAGFGAGWRFARVVPPVRSTPDTTIPPLIGPPVPTTPVPLDDAIPDDSGQDILEYPSASQVCMVGPAAGTGEVFERGSAAPGIDPQSGQWTVTVDLRDDGQATWNAVAQQCFSGSSACPSRQLAIVLDDTIQSAPTVQTPEFPGTVQISGAFAESEVRSLARVLNRGAFPVRVVQQRVETVSPTAGKNSFQSAVIAGFIGVALMLVYMALYYRKLSVVIMGSLVVWGLTVYAFASFVSNTWSYAFTIAGATGIIVSVGVTVDTYVVFFERIRDEQRHGRTIVNAAPRSFAATWTTILAANFISLLAAVVLFWLSVGSVQGFALYLGLTTVCDLLVFWFVARPATYLLAQTRWLAGEPSKPAPTPTIGATS